MALTIAEAGAVNTVLDWLAHIALWEHDREAVQGAPTDRAMTDALILLAGHAHRVLGAGVDDGEARAIACALFDDRDGDQ